MPLVNAGIPAARSGGCVNGYAARLPPPKISPMAVARTGISFLSILYYSLEGILVRRRRRLSVKVALFIRRTDRPSARARDTSVSHGIFFPRLSRSLSPFRLVIIIIVSLASRDHDFVNILFPLGIVPLFPFHGPPRSLRVHTCTY